jgi:hypothetical protein
MSVGMPHTLLLHQFGEHIHRAFGYVAYHVGSSLGPDKSGWRDVDVRLMLPDEEYSRMELGDPIYPHQNKKWVSLCLAWTCFGKQLTGLPIDFQIQQTSHANAKEKGVRSALLEECNFLPPNPPCKYCGCCNCFGECKPVDFAVDSLMGIEGLTPIDPKDLEPFIREMEDKVIPEIIRVMKKRVIDAQISRSKIIA